MNLLKTVLIILAKVWGKIWVFPCIPFRAWATNYVFNYVLQCEKTEWLGRLWERNPYPSNGGWALQDVHNVGGNGYIAKRNVNTFMFYIIVFLIYGWLDSDSNEDTTDKGHIQRIIDNPGKWDIWGRLFRRWLKPVDTVYGNTFDLGDIRAEYPYFHWANTAVWNCRNTAMNFKYLWYEY